MGRVRTSARSAPLAAILVPVTAFLVSGCGGGTPQTPRTTTVTVTPTEAAPSPTTSATTGPGGVPTTFAQAQARVAAGTVDAAAGGAFTSPTGNIFCTIVAGTTPGCELKTGRLRPAAGTCTGGQAKDVGRIELTPQGARPVCNTDSIVKPGVPALKYGSVATVGGGAVSCLSEEVGMTCVDASSKKGFFLSRTAFRLL